MYQSLRTLRAVSSRPVGERKLARAVIARWRSKSEALGSLLLKVRPPKLRTILA